jgi:hypothetical protein
VKERAFVPVVLRSSIGNMRSSLHDFHAEKVSLGLSLSGRALLLAVVFIESDLDFPFGLVLLREVGFELSVTGFAHGDRFARISFYDPKVTRHNSMI